MEWSGQGLVVGVRKHGENSVIVEVMSHGRGRHSGLVRGGRSPKMAALLQAGNTLHLTWRARLDEHLGLFQVELSKPRAAFLIADRQALYASQLLCSHLRLLPERNPQDRLLDQVLTILDSELDDQERAQMLTLFELMLLDDLGFGLDLSSCAVSGETVGLTHVSPRTGRAVTASAGGKYLDRLFALPAYFSQYTRAEIPDILSAFALTGHFLDVHVWNARGIDPPTVRAQIITSLQQSQ